MIFEIHVCGNFLGVSQNGKSGEVISHFKREVCPSCNEANCNSSCDGSQGADESNTETEHDVLTRIQFNAFLDAMESIILGHACSGINIQDEKYIEGLETAFEAAQNNF